MDLVMLSNLGRSDGGRETWAYTFIPLLLKFSERLNLTVYGFTPDGGKDNTEELALAVNPKRESRFQSVFLKVKWARLPLFFSMFYQLRNYFQQNKKNKAELVLGVGGLFEMLMLAYLPTYKKATKVLWLRSIFCNEKANRLPTFLLPLLKIIEVNILRKADILIANGNDIAAYYQPYGLKIHVIKNGVDMEKWSMPQPHMADPINVAYVGRLAEAKGIVEFLKIVEIMKRSPCSSKFAFHVVGDGPYFGEVSRLEKEGMLSFAGAVDHNALPKRLQKFDVCVALTLSKRTGGGGTSNALLEQMAAGRVILAWDNAIFNQLLHDENAYLIDEENLEDAVQALRKIRLEKNSALIKSSRAKSLASTFSIESQIVKFQKIVPSISASLE